MFKFLNFFKQSFFALFLLSCSYSSAVWAQELPQQLAEKIDLLAQKSPQQLVYLQTSKGIYEVGEDLWFKAYLMDSQSSTPFLRDSTLYVQLLKADNHQVVVQEKIQVQHGFAAGHLFIPDTIASGNYVLAAFTPHSFLKTGLVEFKAFRKLSILKRMSTDFELKTTIKQLSADDTSDTILKTKIVQRKIPAINFFPEGGNLVYGLTNVLAFKVTENDGKPLEINGVLLENDLPIQHFKSIHEGMGKFFFTPKLDKRYQVKIEGVDMLFNLPEIYNNGIAMNLVRQNEKNATFLITKTKSMRVGKVLISAQVRGKIYSMFQGEMKSDSLTFTLEASKFPQGIAEVTLYNQTMEPLVERLVYMNLDQNLKIKATLDREHYDIKEKVKLNIKATDEMGKPVIAHLGLSVHEVLYANQYDFLNILSYAHLYSQIKGAIINPDYYFNQKNENRLTVLDLLLLTQGWRKYVWGSETLQTAPEPEVLLASNVSGKIKTSKRTALPTMLIVVASEQSSVDGLIPVSVKGDFSVGVANMQAAEKGYLYVKPLGNEETVKGAKVILDDPFHTINNVMKEKAVIYPFLFKPLLRDTLTVLPKISGLINLNEVVIKGVGNGIAYRDKYLRGLDSIAKYSFSNDYVGQCNWLNCASCGSGTKPKEGVQYSRFKSENRRPIHNVAFTLDEIIRDPYVYPKYTEAELMAKFNISKVLAYQPVKVFYEPNYEQNSAEKNLLDFRNTLIWRPEIITNEKGEAELEFYSSDIKARFIGSIEGMSGTGLLGQTNFDFFVTDKINK